MNVYRRTVMAVAISAVGLSLAACTAGITTAAPAASPSPATTRATSSPTGRASTTASPAASASPANTVSVDAPIGTFPIPDGAQVVFNGECGKDVVIELSSITPAQASSFYMSQLSRAGYKITGNTLLTNTGADAGDGLPGAAAEIEFTGHGYKGTIAALSDLGALATGGASPSDLPSNISKNFITVELTPPGATGCSAAGS